LPLSRCIIERDSFGRYARRIGQRKDSLAGVRELKAAGLIEFGIVVACALLRIDAVREGR
jgi:hypothetical protein